MRLRRAVPCVLCAVVLLGLAGGAISTGAAGTTPPSSASFTAADFSWTVSGSAASRITVSPGATVRFAYPSGGSEHNADFGGGPQPATCTQSTGSGAGTVTGSPLPSAPSVAGWSGSCRFDTPGTYTFHCDLHSFMTGTITVAATGSTTTSTVTSTTSTQTSAHPLPLLAGGVGRAIVVAAHQRGRDVRVSLRLGAGIVGGRAGFSVISGATTIGKLTRGGLRAERLAVRVPLSARGRRLLARRYSLSLRVRVVLRPAHGSPLTVTRRLTLKA